MVEMLDIVQDGFVQLIWDLGLESPTLGGALVLRQEGEILAQLMRVNCILVRVTGTDISNCTFIKKLVNVVFLSSAFHFEVEFCSVTDARDWPLLEDRNNPCFSYFSFSRVVSLSNKHHLLPKLAWNGSVLNEAKKYRSDFGERLVCVHLRNVYPYSILESMADGGIWQQFLDATHCADPACKFLLLGDDDLPENIRLSDSVIRAKDSHIDLSVQLALIGISDLFLGMASGICSAANLSSVPYFIYKHPSHHSAEMARELGGSDAFPFSHKLQKVRRCIVTKEQLFADYRRVFNND
jgi:hypothetical protein